MPKNSLRRLYRRTCLEPIGDYNCQFQEQNAQGYEDWDLYLRLAERYRFRVVPEIWLGDHRIVGSMFSDRTSIAKSKFSVKLDKLILLTF